MSFPFFKHTNIIADIVVLDKSTREEKRNYSAELRDIFLPVIPVVGQKLTVRFDDFNNEVMVDKINLSELNFTNKKNETVVQRIRIDVLF